MKFYFIFLALFFCIVVEVLQKELLIKKKSNTMVTRPALGADGEGGVEPSFAD